MTDRRSLKQGERPAKAVAASGARKRSTEEARAKTEFRHLLERMDRKITELEAQADRLLSARNRA